MAKAENNPLQDVKDDVHDLLDDMTFGSMEELEALLDQYNLQKNSTSVEEFHGRAVKLVKVPLFKQRHMKQD